MSTNTTANTATFDTPNILTEEGARLRLREIKATLLVENGDRPEEGRLSDQEMLEEANRRLEAEQQEQREAAAEEAARSRASDEEGGVVGRYPWLKAVASIAILGIIALTAGWVITDFIVGDDDSMTEFVDDANQKIEAAEQRAREAEKKATAAAEAAKKAEAATKKQAEERELAAKAKARADKLALEKKMEELEKTKKALEEERERVAEAKVAKPAPPASTTTPTGSQPTLRVGLVMDNLESFTTDPEGNSDQVRREDRTIDDIFLGERCTYENVGSTKFRAVTIARGKGVGLTVKVDPTKLASTEPSSRVKSVVKQQIGRDFKVVFLTADQIGGVTAMPDGKKVQLVPRNKITDLPTGEKYVFLELL